MRRSGLPGARAYQWGKLRVLLSPQRTPLKAAPHMSRLHVRRFPPMRLRGSSFDVKSAHMGSCLKGCACGASRWTTKVGPSPTLVLRACGGKSAHLGPLAPVRACCGGLLRRSGLPGARAYQWGKLRVLLSPQRTPLKAAPHMSRLHVRRFPPMRLRGSSFDVKSAHMGSCLKGCACGASRWTTKVGPSHLCILGVPGAQARATKIPPLLCWPLVQKSSKSEQRPK